MTDNIDSIKKPGDNLQEKNERDLLLERLEYIRGRKALLEKIITEEKPQEVLENNEENVQIATELVEEENEDIILREFNKLNEESTKEVIFALNKLAKEKREDFLNKESKTPEELTRMLAETLDKVHSGKVGPLWMKIANKFWNQKNKWLRNSIRLLTLSTGITASVALSYHTPQEYWQLWKNWKERHMDKEGKDDPKIIGISEEYNINKIGDSTNTERTTYDFLGEHKIDYKFGYYKTSVFDLSDRTPPRFKMINNRENYSDIDSAAGITTNLFKKFYNYGEFEPVLKGHTGLGAEKIGDIPVVGYNTKTQQIKAGHYKEFNDDWMVSETYEIPLNFKLNSDSTLNLVYHNQALRMVPVSINEKGKEIPFPIGVSANKDMKTAKPSDCTHFGTLEGGKVIMVCGDKQLQVNGSFSDMFHVYQRLQNEYKGVPIQAFLLDNGSYNLPIWDNDQKITTDEVKKHLLRNTDGGTALVLINDERVSPYEYKNKYKEFQHYTPNFTLDSITHKPAINEKSVIVIHHTGEYEVSDSIIKQFENPASNSSSHVVIMKDGTRYLFNNDNYVLAHAGKSDFNDRNAVNYFSLGIEMEGDSRNNTQFTIAQLESLLEYLRPRIEKYKIDFKNITTHKIIRDNYIKKHPDSTHVQGKVDLDDEVWKQIQELIKKKLYNKISSDSVTDKGKSLLKTISYQDAYRSYKNKELALEQVRAFFKEQGIKDGNLEDVYNLMNNTYESS